MQRLLSNNEVAEATPGNDHEPGGKSSLMDIITNGTNDNCAVIAADGPADDNRQTDSYPPGIPGYPTWPLGEHPCCWDELKELLLSGSVQ